MIFFADVYENLMYFVITFFSISIYDKYSNSFSWKFISTVFFINILSRTIALGFNYMIYRIISKFKCFKKNKVIGINLLIFVWLSGFSGSPLTYILLNEIFIENLENIH